MVGFEVEGIKSSCLPNQLQTWLLAEDISAISTVETQTNQLVTSLVKPRTTITQPPTLIIDTFLRES